MAQIIYPDGTTLPLHPPEDGEAYTLAEVYAAIGCDMVQELWIARDEVLLIDENAKLGNELPRANMQATGMVVGLLPDDKILGIALHVANRDGQWVPLNEKEVFLLIKPTTAERQVLRQFRRAIGPGFNAGIIEGNEGVVGFVADERDELVKGLCVMPQLGHDASVVHDLIHRILQAK